MNVSYLASVSYVWSHDLLRVVFFFKFLLMYHSGSSGKKKKKKKIEFQDLNLQTKDIHRKNLNKCGCQKGKGPEKKKRVDRF